MESKAYPVVVIPVYKKFLDWDQSELISFSRCITVLSDHHIFLVGPRKLDWEALVKQLYQNFNIQVLVEVFDNEYFEGIAGYNNLLKSSFFYSRFKSYSHLLIYQLDAYVFQNQLLEWCSKGYDYIGAPWLEGWTDNTSTIITGVGNGGFSLHNVQNSIKVLKKLKVLHLCLKVINSVSNRKGLLLVDKYLKKILIELIFNIKNTKYLKNLSPFDRTNEDVFWGLFIPTTFTKFKVACIDEAIKFSFEVNPKYLFKLNNSQLPFGCHAWKKYDPIFWSAYIEERNTCIDLPHG